MAPEKAAKQTFRGVVWYDASSVLSDVHRALLQTGGAVEYVCKDGEVKWEDITHVFTNTPDFPGQQDSAKYTKLAIVTVCSTLHFVSGCVLMCLAPLDRVDCKTKCPAKVPPNLSSLLTLVPKSSLQTRKCSSQA